MKTLLHTSPLLVLSLWVCLGGCSLESADRGESAASHAPPRRIIATDEAPAAIGPYSQAVLVGDTLYCAGQIGIDPATGQIVGGGIEAETRQALANLRAVLTSAGFSPADVVQAQVFLADLGDYAAMNAIYAELFADDPPARAAVEVARLPRDARVEIMLVAVKSR
ncbi:MAG: RidA family protein [Acidobacteriota bacterium]|nr:MAG: RidA family protein [Acidobacteriota bacterium]